MPELESIVGAVYFGTSMSLAGMFYYYYRKKRKMVDKLNNASLLSLDGSLTDIVNTSPGKCLQYVVIEGTVQPVGKPLMSQFQEGTAGVVHKVVLKDYSMVWSGVSQTWTYRERVLHQRVNTVPFSLLGSDQATVRVLNPLNAQLDMDIIHEKFHEDTVHFSDIIAALLTGTRPKGKLETERMLKVGTTLTGVGELILDTDQVLKLRPPADGSEYFLTKADVHTLRMQQESRALELKVLATVFAVAATAAVLLWVGRRYYRTLRDRWESQRLRREFERQEGEPSENDCVICLSRPRGCVMLDCGHVCCCFSCYQALPPPATCPICRQNIRRVVPLYQA